MEKQDPLISKIPVGKVVFTQARSDAEEDFYSASIIDFINLLVRITETRLSIELFHEAYEQCFQKVEQDPARGELFQTFLYRDISSDLIATEDMKNVMKYSLTVARLIFANKGDQNTLFKSIFAVDKKQMIDVFLHNSQGVTSIINSETFCTFIHNVVLPGIYSKDCNRNDRRQLCSLIKHFPPGFAFKHISLTDIKSFETTKFLNYTCFMTMPTLVEDWNILCAALIHYSGTLLHDDVSLTNSLLRVIQQGFKTRTVEDRSSAYGCWKVLIDNYKLNQAFLNGSKQIRLLLKPLKAKLSRNPLVTIKRFETYAYLLSSLSEFNPLLDDFLNTIVGPFDEPVVDFPDTDKIDHMREIPALCPKINSTLEDLINGLCESKNLENTQHLIESVKICTLMNFNYDVYYLQKSALREINSKSLWDSLFKLFKSSLRFAQGNLKTVTKILIELPNLLNQKHEELYKKNLELVYMAAFDYLDSVDDLQKPLTVATSKELIVFLSTNPIISKWESITKRIINSLKKVKEEQHLMDVVKTLCATDNTVNCEVLSFALKNSKCYSVDLIIEILSQKHINLLYLPNKFKNRINLHLFNTLRYLVLKDGKYLAGTLKFCWLFYPLLSALDGPIYNELLNLLAFCVTFKTLSEDNKVFIKQHIDLKHFENVFNLRQQYKSPNDSAIYLCVQSLINNFDEIGIVSSLLRTFSSQTVLPAQLSNGLRTALNGLACGILHSGRDDIARDADTLLNGFKLMYETGDGYIDKKNQILLINPFGNATNQVVTASQISAVVAPVKKRKSVHQAEVRPVTPVTKQNSVGQAEVSRDTSSENDSYGNCSIDKPLGQSTPFKAKESVDARGSESDSVSKLLKYLHMDIKGADEFLNRSDRRTRRRTDSRSDTSSTCDDARTRIESRSRNSFDSNDSRGNKISNSCAKEIKKVTMDSSDANAVADKENPTTRDIDHSYANIVSNEKSPKTTKNNNSPTANVINEERPKTPRIQTESNLKIPSEYVCTSQLRIVLHRLPPSLPPMSPPKKMPLPTNRKINSPKTEIVIDLVTEQDKTSNTTEPYISDEVTVIAKKENLRISPDNRKNNDEITIVKTRKRKKINEVGESVKKGKTKQLPTKSVEQEETQPDEIIAVEGECSNNGSEQTHSSANEQEDNLKTKSKGIERPLSPLRELFRMESDNISQSEESFDLETKIRMDLIFQSTKALKNSAVDAKEFYEIVKRTFEPAELDTVLKSKVDSMIL